MATQTIRARLLASSFIVGLTLVGGQAFAQDQGGSSTPTSNAAETSSTKASASPNATTVGELVVTGSRIPRAGFETLEPATVVTAQKLEQRAFANVADALNEMPVFGIPGAANVGDQSQYNVGQNFVNFFGLGSQRTLTLVNGRRFVSSNPPTLFGDAGAGLQVDLNNIPVGLVDRIEVVSVGGAPAYGADAIAGTVNIILKDNFEGFQAEGTYGVRQHGDGQTWQARFLGGGNFADGKGNATVSIEYDKQDGLGFNDSRLLRHDGTFQSDAACTARGFGRCYYEDARVGIVNFGGIPMNDDFILPFTGITNSGGQFVSFAPDGTLQPYNLGTQHGIIFSSGGDGADLNGLTSLVAPLRRILINGFVHYQFTPDVQAYAETYFANSQATELYNQPTYQSALFAPGDSSNLVFSIDNPFLTNQARSILLSDPMVAATGQFYLARANLDLFPSTQQNEVNVYRFVTGLKGDLHYGDNKKLHWDISLNYGRSKGDAVSYDIYDEAFFNAIDAVRDPATGNIVCNVTLHPPAPVGGGVPGVPGGDLVNPAVDGCQPLNLFGQGASSQAARDFVTAKTFATSILEQRDVEGVFNTDLFDNWAGPIGLAGGFEYRVEKGAFLGDAFTNKGLGRAAAVEDLSGSFNSRELFAETTIPLVSPDNNWFIKTAELNGKVRWIDNSRAGQDWVYTVGGRIRPVDDIEFRGNFTRSVRAPAITELFLPLSTTFSFADDPCDPQFITKNATRAANCATEFGALGVNLGTFSSNVVNATATGLAGGNPNLQNEKANSWTVGAVVRPRWIPGWTTSFDWVDIHVSNAISQISLTDLMGACYDATNFPNNQYCPLFTRNAQGQVISFTTPTVNIGGTSFSGLQINSDYRTGVASLPFVHSTNDLGTLQFQLNILYTHKLTDNVLGTPDSANPAAGEFTAPHWRGDFSVRYQIGKIDAFVETRYTSPVSFDVQALPTARDIPGVGSDWVFNGSLAYNITDIVQAQVGVDNIFDNQGPRYADASASAPFVYDVLGRRYTFTVRARF